MLGYLVHLDETLKDVPKSLDFHTSGWKQVMSAEWELHFWKDTESIHGQRLEFGQWVNLMITLSISENRVSGPWVIFIFKKPTSGNWVRVFIQYTHSFHLGHYTVYLYLAADKGKLAEMLWVWHATEDVEVPGCRWSTAVNQILRCKTM